MLLLDVWSCVLRSLDIGLVLGCLVYRVLLMTCVDVCVCVLEIGNWCCCRVLPKGVAPTRFWSCARKAL